MEFNILKNFSLKKYNTFKIDVKSKYFVKLFNVKQLENFFDLQNYKSDKKMVIGEGSNILFTKDFDGVVIFPAFEGIEKIFEDEENVYLKVFSGENWDSFVKYCVENNYSGIENLSLIPGKVGASPVQNIGAYGVEVKDVIERVEFFNILEKKVFEYSNSDCQFEYRNSIFKKELKNQVVIVSVTFRLNKKHTFKTDYKGVKEELSRFEEINLKNIREAIINVRNSKLPDIEEIGSAGSFFKNPIISKEKFESLQKKFHNISYFVLNDDNVKIPAAWLIEYCNFKGFRKKDAGVYDKHSLILVNYDNSSGIEIWNLAKEIITEVDAKFGIVLEPEVIVL